MHAAAAVHADAARIGPLTACRKMVWPMSEYLGTWHLLAASTRTRGQSPRRGAVIIFVFIYNESYKKSRRASAALKAMARLFASAWGRRYARSFRAGAAVRLISGNAEKDAMRASEWRVLALRLWMWDMIGKKQKSTTLTPSITKCRSTCVSTPLPPRATSRIPQQQLGELAHSARCTGGHPDTLCSTEVSREPAVLSRHAATT